MKEFIEHITGGRVAEFFALLVRALAGESVLIVITGPKSSGKTLFGDILVAALPGVMRRTSLPDLEADGARVDDGRGRVLWLDGVTTQGRLRGVKSFAAVGWDGPVLLTASKGLDVEADGVFEAAGKYEGAVAREAHDELCAMIGALSLRVSGTAATTLPSSTGDTFSEAALRGVAAGKLGLVDLAGLTGVSAVTGEELERKFIPASATEPARLDVVVKLWGPKLVLGFLGKQRAGQFMAFSLDGKIAAGGRDDAGVVTKVSKATVSLGRWGGRPVRVLGVAS